MAEYAFVTTWRFDAPIEAVWEAISHLEQWPEWWRYVRRATRLEPGDERGIGALWRHEWRTALPYTFVFDLRTTRVERPYVLEGTSAGELDGTGRWQLSPDGPGGTGTLVRYDWNVRTAKAWMNALAPIARPVFEWNHAVIMAEGGRALARRLGARLLDAQPQPPTVGVILRTPAAMAMVGTAVALLVSGAGVAYCTIRRHRGG
jgi:uncharacterized protein YndB with AHSA1/START domain